MHDLSDDQLMLMVRYGNQAAFALLFDAYRAPIFDFARRMLGDVAAAEDACQEVFVRLAGAAADFQPRGRFRAWLFTIARTCCLGHLRRERRVIPLRPAESENPHDQACASETHAQLERAMEALPEPLRAAFLLRARHGLEYREIADVLGEPLGTVKTHIHRARRRLAETLRPHLRNDA